MLINIPLMIVPFIIYNVVMMTSDIYIWDTILFGIPMVSEVLWLMRLSDLMIVIGLFLLFFEILKSTRIGVRSVVNHLLSTIVLIVYLVEFLLVGGAATSVFFILLIMSLVDLMAGFSVSIRAAVRDITLGDAQI